MPDSQRGGFLPVYARHAAGKSPRDVPGPKQTGAELESFHVRLPCEAASVPQAREQVREWCHEARIRGDVVADVQLAVTEAVTNAVRHSACVDFEIQGWITRTTLIVSVWDHGRGRGDPEAGAGLGTRIIRALADSVDIEDAQPGTRVTMRFPRHAYLHAVERSAP
jgi:serine/threonine-protein kinase RsbW